MWGIGRDILLVDLQYMQDTGDNSQWSITGGGFLSFPVYRLSAGSHGLGKLGNRC